MDCDKWRLSISYFVEMLRLAVVAAAPAVIIIVVVVIWLSVFSLDCDDVGWESTVVGYCKYGFLFMFRLFSDGEC